MCAVESPHRTSEQLLSRVAGSWHLTRAFIGVIFDNHTTVLRGGNSTKPHSLLCFTCAPQEWRKKIEREVECFVDISSLSNEDAGPHAPRSFVFRCPSDTFRCKAMCSV